MYTKSSWVWEKEQMYRSFLGFITQVKKSNPNSKIVIIGPVPNWHGSPQATAFNEYRESRSDEVVIPTRHQAIVKREVDHRLEKLSREAGVIFLSLNDILCQREKCISRVGTRPEDFIATDVSHLSKAGSIYVAQQIKPYLLGLLN